MKNTITFIAVLFCLTIHAQKIVNASDIIQKIKNGKSVEVSNATISGVLDFTFMNDALPKLPKRKSWWNNGGSNTIEKQITNKISFINCTFNDNVLAYIPHEKSGYTFVANFESDVIFKNCNFKQKAMFKYSEFERNTDFSNTKFNDDSTFKYAKFERNITFENTFFEEPATFKYSEFKEGVSFKNVNFKEDLNIKYTNVSGDFNITDMNVAYEIDSKYTNINGKSFNTYLLNNKK